MENLNQQLLAGLATNDSQAVETIYSKVRPITYRFITNNSGGEQDVEDVIQEVLLIIYEKVRRGLLELKGTSFTTYYYSVMRNTWFNRIRDKKRRGTVTNDLEWLSTIKDDMEPETYPEGFYRFVYRHFKKLKPECQMLLNLRAKELSYTEIVEKHAEFKNEGQARVMLLRCRERLLKMMKDDPDWKEYID